MSKTRRNIRSILLPQETDTAVSKAVSILRDEVLFIAEEGVFLGSEEELIERLKVSRATFRQAIRVLEYEELVVIRRGVGGGFFTRSPTVGSVARMAAVYMSFQRTPIAQVLQASNVMRKEATRIICASQNMELRSAPRWFIEKNQGFPAWADRRKAIRVVTEFHQLIGDLSGNTALELFMDVIKLFGNRSDGLMFTAHRLSASEKIINAQALAIEEGDAVLAVELCDEELLLALSWLSTSRET